MNGNWVEAAVGVLVRDDGAVLIAKRPERSPCAGWWELPGGKLEKGESPRGALERELLEEIGIRRPALYPWFSRRVAYPHANVRLFFFFCESWEGNPLAREGQELHFQKWGKSFPGSLLPNVAEAIRWTRMPRAASFSGDGPLSLTGADGTLFRGAWIGDAEPGAGIDFLVSGTRGAMPFDERDFPAFAPAGSFAGIAEAMEAGFHGFWAPGSRESALPGFPSIL